MPKIKTKRFDRKMPFPEYEEGAAGFDFICREEVVFEAGEIKAISSNLAMEIPKGYVLLVVSRSSTHVRFKLAMPHSLGVIDPFYHGDDNEIMLIFNNFGKESVTVKKGEKIAQGILVKYEKVEFEDVERLGKSDVRKWGE